MQLSLTDLPLETLFEITEFLPLAHLARFARTTRFLAGIGTRRLYEALFTNKIHVDGIAKLKSHWALEYIERHTEKLLTTKYDVGQSLLHHVARSGNVPVLDILLKHAGANLNEKDDKGWSPLHIALRDGHDMMILRLLDAGADVLALAADQIPTVGLPHNDTQRDTVEKLIAAFQTAGGDISTGADVHSTPLHYASRYGNDRIVEILLAHGADAFVQDKRGYIPLIIAVRWGKVECTRLLLKAMARDPRGYDINAPIPVVEGMGHYAKIGMLHRAGGIILHFAVCTGHVPMVQLLLEHGADSRAEDNPPEGRRETPFDTAVVSGRLDLIKLFLQMDDPPRYWKSTGAVNTGLYGAVRWPKPEYVQLLVGLSTRGLLHLNLDQATSPTFSICRDYNDQSSAQRTNDCIITLVDAGMDLNKQDKHGLTFLHHLCQSSRESHLQKKIELMEYLLDAGADWTLRAYQEDTVLHRLARIVHLGFDGLIRKIARMERGREAISSVNQDGNTVLHLYLHNANPALPDRAETVRMLVEAGCDLNVLNKDGRGVAHTILFPMVSPEVVDYFAGLGMDFSLLDWEGKPPLHYLVTAVNMTKTEQELVARFLIKKGAAQHAGCQECEAYISSLYASDSVKLT
ncbi:ankyrin repeat-containing domain protein [Aspergillus heterothallicus]